jgi:hypothetical protein
MTRNLFDQYDLYENRLTHALLCALSFDRQLLARFLGRYAKGERFDGRMLKVAEQTLPGTPEPTIDLETKKSLPDGVIFEDTKGSFKDTKRRALIIESKIASPLTNDQLQRHTNGVRARGYLVSGLAITADTLKADLPEGWTKTSWSDIYQWLVRLTDKSVWSIELIHFFDVLEAQMVNDNSIGDRALTRFNGVPFNLDHPYSYPEAKRLIRLLRAKILKDRSVCKKLDLAPEIAGKAAITDGPAVWDYFSLRNHPKGKAFTFFPHMTFSIGPKIAAASITVPNAVRRDILAALRNASVEKLQDAASTFASVMTRNTKKMNGVRPTITLVQRRFKNRRSAAFHDATLNFDLRTAFGPTKKRTDRVQPKYQPEWLQLVQGVIKGKHSNLQFQIGCEFDYGACTAIKQPDAEMLFVNAWLAARAFFKAIGIHL